MSGARIDAWARDSAGPSRCEASKHVLSRNADPAEVERRALVSALIPSAAKVSATTRRRAPRLRVRHAAAIRSSALVEQLDLVAARESPPSRMDHDGRLPLPSARPFERLNPALRNAWAEASGAAAMDLRR
jgi:hypothetical protein